MKKRLIVAFMAAATAASMTYARNAETKNASMVVTVDAKSGFMFWDKSVIVTGFYEGGNIQRKAKKRRTAVEFLFEHPKKGALERIEVKNSRDIDPTVIMPVQGGKKYDITFDKATQSWVVSKIKEWSKTENKEHSVKVKNGSGFWFWGKEVAVTGIYKRGELEQKIPGKQEVIFLMKHPEKGALKRLEIRNPDEGAPTLVKPESALEYTLVFSDQTQKWYVQETKRMD